MTSPLSPAVRLQVLGPVAVTRGSDTSIAPLLTQPRRLAVLVYLVLAHPRGLHSRDTLIVMLWPEADQAGGRHALRNVLHAIRQALGSDVITTAGDGMVGVNFESVLSDAIELERDLAEGRVDEAIARYHGELLQGFHVSETPEFERWLDAERRRFTELVLAAAWSLADSKWNAGDLGGALQTARRAAAIAPDDEISLRRFLRFLDEAGDRFGAVRAYDEFAERLKREYDAEPSAETQAVARALRETPLASTRTHNSTVMHSAGVDQSRPTDSPRTAEVRPATVNMPASDPSVAGAGQPVLSDSGTHRGAVATAPPRRRRTKWLWAIGAAVVLVIAALAARSRAKPEPSAEVPSKLLVLPMENETGDPALDYVGTGLAEGIATRLEGIGGITVRSGARSDWPAATRHDYKEIGRQFGSVILLKTTLNRANDSLEVRASLLDLASSREKSITARRFTTNGLRDLESELAASVAGAVFGVALPVLSGASARAVVPESYRLMLAGWHQLTTMSNSSAAKELFLEAIRADPSNARAWSGLAAALGGGGGGNIVGEGLDESEAAAGRALALDSLQGSALASLGMARAFRYRNLADGLVWVKKAIAVDPSNPQVFFILGVLYRHAWMWDEAIDAFRIAERLDPLSAINLNREAAAELCARRPERALPLFRREYAMSTTDTAALFGLSRSYAALGHYDEAIARWREKAQITNDTTLASVLSRAKGRAGYWAAKHYDGRRRVAASPRVTTRNRVHLMWARFAAGDFDGGFSDMDALERERSVALYRLPCLSDLDEVRDSLRYKAALRRIGPLPQR